MITPFLLSGGATFTVPEPSQLTGVVLSVAATTSADLSLNGNKIAFGNSSVSDLLVFIPLKITLKTGDKLKASADGASFLYFS